MTRPFNRRTGTCAHCHKPGTLVGRGLDNRCYQAARNAHILNRYPRLPRTRTPKPQPPRALPVAECARCHKVRPIAARGLDGTCWAAAKSDGTLIDYPRRNRAYTDTVADVAELTAAGIPAEQIAARLGYAHTDSLRATLWLARRAVA